MFPGLKNTIKMNKMSAADELHHLISFGDPKTESPKDKKAAEMQQVRDERKSMTNTTLDDLRRSRRHTDTPLET